MSPRSLEVLRQAEAMFPWIASMVAPLVLASGADFPGWQSLNDTIMGGRSQGRCTPTASPNERTAKLIRLTPSPRAQAIASWLLRAAQAEQRRLLPLLNGANDVCGASNCFCRPQAGTRW